MQDVDALNGNRREGSPAFDNNLFHQISISDPNSRSISTFTVPKRYTELQFLNAGAQGTVAKALDKVTGEWVAIKKMQQPFVMAMSAKRAYREFILLTTIKHPNIIRLLNAFTPQTSVHNFREVYLVMELMSHNLHEVVHKLRLDHKTLSFFVYQMLCAIRHLHSAGVIHRDLKPSNIVVNDRCTLKVLDFGLARKQPGHRADQNTDMRMSDYVVTRYYRAPEVILGMGYTEKVDIWSVGCIFAEMVTHRVLFPGRDRIDQWTSIIKQMGTPEDKFIDRLGTSASLYVRSLPRYPKREMSDIVPDQDFLSDTAQPQAHLTAEASRDLLSHMLKIDPSERYSVDEALNHPYVRLWFKDEEVNSPPSENRYNAEIDYMEKTLTEWKELIFSEVSRWQSRHDVFKE